MARVATDVEVGVPERVQRFGGYALRMVAQPIVRLADRGIAGYEALARFVGYPDLGPDEIFRLAESAGIGVELEIEAIGRACAHLPLLPAGTFLSLNASPKAVAAPGLERTLLDAGADRLVLELTEQQDVSSYVWLNRALLALRVAGLTIAVDDVGRGYANWGHLIHIQPDLIKLDGQLTGEVVGDPVRRTVIKALVAIAADLDAELVAEQVETEAQATVLRELGVSLGQGFLFGRPAAFEDLHPTP